MLSIIDQSIKNRFGSRRGLIRAIRYRASMMLGAYSRYQNVDFEQIDRLVFICSGNICRSALGHVIAESQNIPSDSYGLHCRGGDKADPRAVAYASSIGLDLSSHVTKNIKNYDPRAGDLLIGMEPRHTDTLEKVLEKNSTLTLAGLWLDKPTAYLHDPYNANDIFFEICERLVAESTRNLAKRLEQ